MKTLHLSIVITIISFCIVSIIPSYAVCFGTFVPRIQKDSGTDAEGYHTYQAYDSDNLTYPVKYKISSKATLEAIFYEKPPYPKFNIVMREVSQGGNLTIKLPTKLLGSYNRDYSVATGAMCAAIIYRDFPAPMESNPDFTTVSFPLMNYSGVNEMMIIGGNYETPEGNQTVPEFPLVLPILLIGITSLFLFYRLKPSSIYKK